MLTHKKWHFFWHHFCDHFFVNTTFFGPLFWQHFWCLLFWCITFLDSIFRSLFLSIFVKNGVQKHAIFSSLFAQYITEDILHVFSYNKYIYIYIHICGLSGCVQMPKVCSPWRQGQISFEIRCISVRNTIFGPIFGPPILDSFFGPLFLDLHFWTHFLDPFLDINFWLIFMSENC